METGKKHSVGPSKFNSLAKLLLGIRLRGEFDWVMLKRWVPWITWKEVNNKWRGK